MIFDKPNEPEIIEVMNENQNKPLEVSKPTASFGLLININVKNNCGMDSTKGSENVVNYRKFW